MAQPLEKDVIDRAIAIRDHLEPLILTASKTDQMSDVPILLFMVAAFTISYRRLRNEKRLEIWQRRRLMQLRWNGSNVVLGAFRPGGWERDILRLQAV
jgi:hypothetical protein